MGPPQPAEPAGGTGPIGRAAFGGFVGPGRQQRRSRRPFILSGVAVTALLAGASVALAATAQPRSLSPAARAAAATPAPTPSPPVGPDRGMGPLGRSGPGGWRYRGLGLGLGAGMFGAVHGQIVMAKPGGGYRTVDIQTGQITAVSATSVTLRSADGFTRTYAITSTTIVDAQRGGIGSVRTGNEASLLATVSGSTATAVRIEDLTLLWQQLGQAYGVPSMRAPHTPGAQTG